MNSRKRILGLTLHMLFWYLSVMVFSVIMFGHSSCWGEWDCNAQKHRELIFGILGWIWYVVGWLAVFGSWIGWRMTKYLLWILVASWAWFTVYEYQSIPEVQTLLIGIPTVIYIILAILYSKSQATNLNKDNGQ
jgi:hypothetical protein